MHLRSAVGAASELFRGIGGVRAARHTTEMDLVPNILLQSVLLDLAPVDFMSAVASSKLTRLVVIEGISGLVLIATSALCRSSVLSRTGFGGQCEPTERLDYVASPLRRRTADPPLTLTAKLDEPLKRRGFELVGGRRV